MSHILIQFFSFYVARLPPCGTLRANGTNNSDTCVVWASLWIDPSCSSSSRAFSESQSVWRTNVGTMPTSGLLILQSESIAPYATSLWRILSRNVSVFENSLTTPYFHAAREIQISIKNTDFDVFEIQSNCNPSPEAEKCTQ